MPSKAVMMRSAAGAVLLSGLILGATAPVSGQVAGRTKSKPERRIEYFTLQRADSTGAIPPGARERARAELEQRFGRAAPGHGPQFAVFGAAGTQATDTVWRALGPAPIPLLFISSTGRLTTIAVHPDSSSTIYIGGAQGGVWKTSDGGASWTPLTDFECSLSMGSIAIDPVNPSIVYAGTGEGHVSADSYYGCGVLRSVDAGATWTRFGAAEFDFVNGGARIAKVLIDESTAGSSTATTVYAGSSAGLYRSLNSGSTWTRVLRGWISDLVQHPDSAAVLYAAVGFAFGSQIIQPADTLHNGIYKSTNSGTTWTRLLGVAADTFPRTNVGRVNLAIAPSSPATVYASVQDAIDGTANDTRLLGIWKTTNSGANWTRLSATGATCNFQCWYDMVVAVHPADANLVYFGGVPLFRSSNGGVSFTDISGGIHVDHHAFAFDPANPSIIYSGNDGGIYRSANGGDSWTSLNSNLALTQFYGGVSLHPTDTTVILGGTQDNGTVRYSGTPAWTNVLGGDGGFTAIDYVTPSTSYAETQWDPSFGGPRRSDNGGGYVQRVSGIVMSDNALFIPPLVMSTINPHVLLFGTERLYRTSNRGDSWTAISADLTPGSGAAISAITPSPLDSMMVYAGTSNGRLYVTTNLGGSWTEGTGLPGRYISDVVTDPSDVNTAWAAIGGFGTGHIFRTTNGGVSWTDVSGDFPNIAALALVLQPGNPGEMYAGTDLGILKTVNGGVNWTPFNASLPNAAVFDLTFNPSTGHLVAATHGRGAFVAPIAEPAPGIRGTVTYYTGSALPDVALTIPVGAATPDTSSSDGSYSIEGATIGEDIHVTPTKTGDHNGAISAFDAARILRCVAGLETCDADRTRAADVTGDASLSALDASQVLQYVVGLIASFPAGEWVFDPPSRVYEPLSGTLFNQSFKGFLVGDASGNWQAAAAPPVLAYGAAPAREANARVQLTALSDGGARAFELAATSADGSPVTAVEATLAFDAASHEVVGVEAVVSGAMVAHRVDAGRVHVAVAGAEGGVSGSGVARVHLRAKAGAGAGSLVALRGLVNDVAASVAGVQEGAPERLRLRQNVPNPFSAASGTQLTVEVPAAQAGAARVSVRVFTVRGAAIRSLLDDALPAGIHSVQWDGRDDGGDVVASGVYVVVAESGGARDRVRVIFVR